MLNVNVKFKDGTVRNLDADSRDDVEQALQDMGVSPADVSITVLRDTEKMRGEARELGAKTDSIAKANAKPGLVEGWAGDIFPSAVEKGSDFGPWDAVTDMASYMLRAPGAMLDAANPYSTRTADNRYGIRESLEDSQKDRWGFDVPVIGTVSPGALLHGSLHDKMTPLMAVPGAGIARMTNIGKGLAGRMAGGGIAGAVTGGLTELLRPALTERELSESTPGDIGRGFLSGLMLGGFSPLPGAAVSGMGRWLEKSIPRTREKLAGIAKVRPEALEVASTDYGMEQLRKHYGTQGDIADDLSGLYNRFNSETNFPEYRIFQKALDEAQGVADVYPVGKGARNFRQDMLREMESPELMASTEAAANRLERNARHYDPLPRADQSGLERIMLGDGVELMTGNNPVGVDIEPVSLRGAKAIQRSKQIVQSDLASDYNRAQLGQTDLETAIMKQQARDLRKLLDGILKSEGTEVAARGREALSSMANKNRSLEKAQKMLSLGKDLDNMPNKAESAIKGLYQENSSRNARRRAALQLVDDAFDTDLLGRSRYASLAANLAEPGAEIGGPFVLSGTNKHLTGRSLMGVNGIPVVGGVLSDLAGYTPRGAVRRLRGEQAVANGLQSLGDLMQNGYIPFYQRPASEPVKLFEDDRKNNKATSKGKGKVRIGDLVMEDQGNPLDYMIPGVGGIARKRVYVK